VNPAARAYLNNLHAQLAPHKPDAAELAEQERQRAMDIAELMDEIARHAAARRPPTEAEVAEAELELARREELYRLGLWP
jgi:hypothetical protein